MQTSIPKCYSCPNFQGAPNTIGAKAKCKAYANGVPNSIFFEGKSCSKRPKTQSSKTIKKKIKSSKK